MTKEDNYAKAWSKGKQSKVEGVEDHMVRRDTGIPFSEAEWILFAEKYTNEAKVAYANFVPDSRALSSRLLKAASMLIAALQTNVADQQELDDIAGYVRPPERKAPKRVGWAIARVLGMGKDAKRPFKEQYDPWIYRVPVMMTSIPEVPEAIFVGKRIATKTCDSPLTYTAMDLIPMKAMRVR